MGEALSRLAIDGVFIVAAGVLVFGGKQFRPSENCLMDSRQVSYPV